MGLSNGRENRSCSNISASSLCWGQLSIHQAPTALNSWFGAESNSPWRVQSEWLSRRGNGPLLWALQRTSPSLTTAVICWHSPGWTEPAPRAWILRSPKQSLLPPCARKPGPFSRDRRRKTTASILPLSMLQQRMAENSRFYMAAFPSPSTGRSLARSESEVEVKSKTLVSARQALPHCKQPLAREDRIERTQETRMQYRSDKSEQWAAWCAYGVHDQS